MEIGAQLDHGLTGQTNQTVNREPHRSISDLVPITMLFPTWAGAWISLLRQRNYRVCKRLTVSSARKGKKWLEMSAPQTPPSYLTSNRHFSPLNRSSPNTNEANYHLELKQRQKTDVRTPQSTKLPGARLLKRNHPRVVWRRLFLMKA